MNFVRVEFYIDIESNNLKWNNDFEAENGHLNKNIHIYLIFFHLSTIKFFLFIKSQMFSITIDLFESAFW